MGLTIRIDNTYKAFATVVVCDSLVCVKTRVPILGVCVFCYKELRSRKMK
jgi:hypothetical protein